MRRSRILSSLAGSVLATVFLGVVVLVQSSALASQTKQCKPAYGDNPAPDPCTGSQWSSAFPGSCIGPLGALTCVVDGTTNVTIKEYNWGQNENGECAATPIPGHTNTVQVAQCRNI
jgi:hypothetical protein